MNRPLKHKWIMGAINWYLNSYKIKAEKYRGKEWGNTWVMRMNPDGHDKGRKNDMLLSRYTSKIIKACCPEGSIFYVKIEI